MSVGATAVEMMLSFLQRNRTKLGGHEGNNCSFVGMNYANHSKNELDSSLSPPGFIGGNLEQSDGADSETEAMKKRSSFQITSVVTSNTADDCYESGEEEPTHSVGTHDTDMSDDASDDYDDDPHHAATHNIPAPAAEREASVNSSKPQPPALSARITSSTSFPLFDATLPAPLLSIYGQSCISPTKAKPLSVIIPPDSLYLSSPHDGLASRDFRPRFRIVKLRSQRRPVQLGRWTCVDFADPSSTESQSSGVSDTMLVPSEDGGTELVCRSALAILPSTPCDSVLGRGDAGTPELLPFQLQRSVSMLTMRGLASIGLLNTPLTVLDTPVTTLDPPLTFLDPPSGLDGLGGSGKDLLPSSDRWVRVESDPAIGSQLQCASERCSSEETAPNSLLEDGPDVLQGANGLGTTGEGLQSALHGVVHGVGVRNGTTIPGAAVLSSSIHGAAVAGAVHGAAVAGAIPECVQGGLVCLCADMGCESLCRQLCRNEEEHADSEFNDGITRINTKITEAMDLVKRHLMYTVNEELDYLQGLLEDLVKENERLSSENCLLRAGASDDTLDKLHRS